EHECDEAAKGQSTKSKLDARRTRGFYCHLHERPIAGKAINLLGGTAMPRLIGREGEIAGLRAAYAAVTRESAARAAVIVGPAGIGKTALTNVLEEIASPAASIVRVSAQPFDRVLPFALLERMGSDVYERLGRATREHPAVVVVRDAQFADDESLASLMAHRRTFANRPLFLVFTYSDDDEREWARDVDMRVSLAELNARDATALAREHYPNASRGVLDAIVANAHGIPYEVVTIASAASRRGATNPESVDVSARAAVAKELAFLPQAQRTGLQMLSLLSEPVEPTPFDVEVPLAFAQLDHPLTAAAIHETIAMKIPLHRRIVGALERRGARTLRERLVYAEQAAASGDRALAKRALSDLAFVAAAERNARAVTWASERHLEIGEPPDERFIDFYNNFFIALMATRAFARAEAVVAHALSEAQHRQLRGLGSLVAHLVQAQWMVERPEAAKASYERYARALEDPDDLELLRAAAPWLNAV
ncbi:MAG TPA: ATP-binding protein, partial [Candidatus Aquilonibacter sp.]